MKIDLACGRSVVVDAIYYKRTYISLLEGRPNKRINDRILETARTQMIPLWGKRRVHVIPPVTDASDPAFPVLPRMQLTVWLTCYEPIEDINDGSELVVVWFRDECFGEPLNTIIGDAVSSLAWEEIAEDFSGW